MNACIIDLAYLIVLLYCIYILFIKQYFNWFSQMHPGDQFFFVILTNQFLQCVVSA
jgi:hypothetical protein